MPRWRVDFIGKVLSTLGTVEAADEKSAIAPAWRNKVPRSGRPQDDPNRSTLGPPCGANRGRRQYAGKSYLPGFGLNATTLSGKFLLQTNEAGAQVQDHQQLQLDRL